MDGLTERQLRLCTAHILLLLVDIFTFQSQNKQSTLQITYTLETAQLVIIIYNDYWPPTFKVATLDVLDIGKAKLFIATQKYSPSCSFCTFGMKRSQTPLAASTMTIDWPECDTFIGWLFLYHVTLAGGKSWLVESKASWLVARQQQILEKVLFQSSTLYLKRKNLTFKIHDNQKTTHSNKQTRIVLIG